MKYDIIELKTTKKGLKVVKPKPIKTIVNGKKYTIKPSSPWYTIVSWYGNEH